MVCSKSVRAEREREPGEREVWMAISGLERSVLVLEAFEIINNKKFKNEMGEKDRCAKMNYTPISEFDREAKEVQFTCWAVILP